MPFEKKKKYKIKEHEMFKTFNLKPRDTIVP